MAVGPKIAPVDEHDTQLSLNSMILRAEYAKALFIYPDSLETLTSFDAVSGQCLRAYNRHGLHKAYPRSAPIAIGTNWFGPFTNLTSIGVKEAVDASLDEIRTLLKNHEYTYVFFPAVHIDFQGGPRFGLKLPSRRSRGGPYNAGHEVADYITSALLAMGEPKC